MTKAPLPIKKTKQTETKVRLEHVSIVHNSIRVDLLINYKTMEISLCDVDGNKKHWMFCERSLSYQDGWNNILAAMQVAMDFGFEKLRDRLEKDSRICADKLQQALVDCNI